MEWELKKRWRTVLAIVVIAVVGVVLLYEVIVGLTSSYWDLPVLIVLSFALWMAIYVFLRSHEEPM